jgi:hypothetical protein
MILSEYLKIRIRANGKASTFPAISMKEAILIGIDYPLKSGWAQRNENKEVPQELVDIALKGEICFRRSKTERKAELAILKAQKKYKKDKKKKQTTIKDNYPIPKIDPNTDSFLQSYEWRKVRLIVLKRDGAKCACCGATPNTGAVMNVDHIKPRKHFPHLALDPNNLQVLCHECNHGKGNWDRTDFRDKDGDVVIMALDRLSIGAHK